MKSRFGPAPSIRRSLSLATLLLLAAGCSGGGARPVPASGFSNEEATAVTASSVPTPMFVDWLTYARTHARTGYVPDTVITPKTVASLRPAWSVYLNGTGTYNNVQTQPVLATNVTDSTGKMHAGVLYAGGGGGSLVAIDALTGVTIWSKILGQGTFYCGQVVGSSTQGSPVPIGVSGTAVIDRSLNVVFAPDGIHRVHALDLGTGAERAGWPVDVVPALTGISSAYTTADQANLRNVIHTALTFVGGQLYVGTGSFCDASPWEGRVADIDVNSATLAHVFYSIYGQTANNPSGSLYSGGGVWGWGGVSADSAGNVYAGVGNADTNRGAPVDPGNPSPPPPMLTAPSETVGYGEEIVQLSKTLSVEQAASPGFVINPPYGEVDQDFSGTPVIFSPHLQTCELTASQGKAGALISYNTATMGSGPVFRAQLSQSSDVAHYIGNPAYSPITGLLYAAVASSHQASDPNAPPISFNAQPGMIAFHPGCTSSAWSLAWQTSFGPDSVTLSGNTGNAAPRSAPTVTSGGVVFMGTPNGKLWALDANTGAVLNGGIPIYISPNDDQLRMAPVVDGQWVFFESLTGFVYALTTNPAYQASPSKLQSFPVSPRAAQFPGRN